MAVLVLNCGSSSVKFAVLDPEEGGRPLQGIAEKLGSSTATLKIGASRSELRGGRHEDALAAILAALREASLLSRLAAVGHRVVHGGERFTTAALVDDAVEGAIESLIRLAPLHNPANLLGIRIARAALPDLPQVAVFDTAFHQTMPAAAYRYGVPQAWYREQGVRRYGFHGTSHRYVAERAASILRRPLGELHLLTAHLGNGCSATAVAGGRSVDTTMGLTPLGGVVMGSRSGDLDPGILGHMADSSGADLGALLHTLNHESGLRGLSGLSNDMRNLLEARALGDERATLAIDVYCHRLASALLGLCASLPRLDALVFTGGIGENAAPIRAEVVARLGLLGLELDAQANAAHGHGTGHIHSGAGPAILVIPTDEELMIARETQSVCRRVHA